MHKKKKSAIKKIMTTFAAITILTTIAGLGLSIYFVILILKTKQYNISDIAIALILPMVPGVITAYIMSDVEKILHRNKKLDLYEINAPYRSIRQQQKKFNR